MPKIESRADAVNIDAASENAGSASNNILSATTDAVNPTQSAKGRCATSAIAAAELANFLGGHKNGQGWIAPCPAHADNTPSLSIREVEGGKVLLKCFAGCTQTAVIAALTAKGLWPKANGAVASGQDHYGATGVTLEQLAEAKHFDVGYLRGLGVADTKHGGAPAVKIPYCDENGTIIAVRYRVGLSKRFPTPRRY